MDVFCMPVLPTLLANGTTGSLQQLQTQSQSLKCKHSTHTHSSYTQMILIIVHGMPLLRMRDFNTLQTQYINGREARYYG